LAGLLFLRENKDKIKEGRSKKINLSAKSGMIFLFLRRITLR